jgi:GT2 family glycosyltransferase
VSSAAPAISVVVASHERALRLRWLLNALEEQTLARGEFEVIVCHDSRGPETEELLRSHPLALSGTLRGIRLPAGNNPPGRQRNVAWRQARASLVAFTDDDCRPPADWLERALGAAGANPGAIVQGATRPDPDELELAQRAPHSLTQTIDPPVPWAQTCNIVYPRSVLERTGGFDDGMAWVEDADLAQRARDAGVPYVGAPELLTYHAVHALAIFGRVRAAARWQQVALLVKRHPALRRHYPARCFWNERHGWMLLALGGAALGALTRRPLLGVAFSLPWARSAAPTYGCGPRGRARSLLELPGRAAVDAAELVALTRGSIRHRTLFL